MFTKELVQAVSDWQRGGSADQKAKRAERLASLAKDLSPEFRKDPSECFRQIGLNESSLRNLGTHLELPETISSWTCSLDVAKAFKGGVPAKGSDYIGVVFRREQGNGSVIINLAKLFACAQFLDFVKTVQHHIEGFSKGMGRYWGTQQEVVIEVSELPLDSLLTWGGFARTASEYRPILERELGRKLLDEEVTGFATRAGADLGGQYWTQDPESMICLAKALKHHTNRLAILRNPSD